MAEGWGVRVKAAAPGKALSGTQADAIKRWYCCGPKEYGVREESLGTMNSMLLERWPCNEWLGGILLSMKLPGRLNGSVLRKRLPGNGSISWSVPYANGGHGSHPGE